MSDQRFNRNKAAITVVGLILILITVFAFVLPRNGAAAENAYQVEVVERGDLTTVVGAIGTVRLYQSVSLVWQTSGIIESVNAQLGDRVQTGALLAALEQSSLPQDVILAEANLASAQKALDDLLGFAKKIKTGETQ